MYSTSIYKENKKIRTWKYTQLAINLSGIYSGPSLWGKQSFVYIDEEFAINGI